MECRLEHILMRTLEHILMQSLEHMVTRILEHNSKHIPMVNQTRQAKVDWAHGPPVAGLLVLDGQDRSGQRSAWKEAFVAGCTASGVEGTASSPDGIKAWLAWYDPPGPLVCKAEDKGDKGQAGWLISVCGVW
ncbi:hypothetical protein E4U21_005487 [Claviceps maximensis]|nr:hypothetical protein E4U21_005487 [Claviceps maximensis]